MPREEQIPTEFYQSGSRIKVYLKKIEQDAKGKTLIVSRSDPNFLRALFEMEVPEIASGTVEIMHIAREAGSRSKVAVRSNAEGVDPIGSCVGQRGSRINSITNELKTTRGEEKIDIIPWSEDTRTFLANAIRPAEAIEVKLTNEKEKHALILVDDDYLSLAIGREGQNVRLAVKLTGWKLDIQGAQSYKGTGETTKSQKPEELEEKVVEKKEKTKSDTKTSKSAKSTKTKDNASWSDQLGMQARIITSLEKAGITSLDQLKAKVKSGEKISGVGAKSMEEIVKALS
jgi:N utilization substance protein A